MGEARAWANSAGTEEDRVQSGCAEPMVLNTKIQDNTGTDREREGETWRGRQRIRGEPLSGGGTGAEIQMTGRRQPYRPRCMQHLSHMGLAL